MGKKGIIETINSLKENLTDAKANLNRLEGQKETILKTLQKNYGIKTVEEAKKKLSSMKREIESLNTELEKLVDDMETKYGTFREIE